MLYKLHDPFQQLQLKISFYSSTRNKILPSDDFSQTSIASRNRWLIPSMKCSIFGCRIDIPFVNVRLKQNDIDKKL
jgi:hypothetical protein